MRGDEEDVDDEGITEIRFVPDDKTQLDVMFTVSLSYSLEAYLWA